MMKGWKEIALNEIGWFKGAGVNKLINTDEQPVYLVNYMDVYKHWKVYYNTNYQEVTAKDREIEEANLLEGDVLFTPSSEKPIDIGHAGVVMETMPNCVYSYHLIRLRLYDKTQFDLKFLSYLLNSDNVQKHFVSRASGSGIRYTLSLSDFKSAKIRFPEKPEQSAIAAMLSKVDEAIAAVQGSIAAAERLKKSLMQNLLTGRMKPDGSLRTEEEFYLDEKFGRVPKGWHWGHLSEIAEIIAGQSPQGEYYNEDGIGYPMLNGPTEFTDKYPVPVQWTTKVTKLCQKGDILFTVRGSSTGRMNFADQEYCIGRGLAAIRPKSNSSIQFIYYTLLKISEMILAEAKGAGTTFPNVSRGDLMKKEILIPDNQEEIVKQICSTESTIILKQNKIAVLERLKKSLMQNLLTGKVRVNQQ